MLTVPMVAARITPEQAVDSVCELLRRWFAELELSLGDKRSELPCDLVDLATALATSDPRDALRQIDAVFAAHYPETVLELTSGERDVGRVAGAWRLVRAAKSDCYR